MTITETIMSIHPLLLIIGFSFIVTIISVLVYKFFTNQAEMKRLKEELKAHQKEMRDHRGDQKKLLEIQKKAMEKNMRYMQHSFKPMIFTFIPIILLFGWFQANLAYFPLLPGEPFNVTVFSSVDFNLSIMPNSTIEIMNKTAGENYKIFTLKGEEGHYTMFFDSPNVEQKSIEFIITKKQQYKGPIFNLKGDGVKKVVISNSKMLPFGKSFNIFGYHPGWFITYFVSAIIFNSILRKILRVY